MNSSAYRLCLKLVTYHNTKQILNSSSKYQLYLPNNTQSLLITRTVLTRPKEFDQLKKRAKERTDDQDDGYYKDPKYSSSERIGAYGYFLLSIPVIATALGTWQIKRRTWKLNLIKDLGERMSREPIELPENLDDLAELEYCPIKVRGKFLYDKEFTVGPRTLIVDGEGATERRGNLISGSALNKGYIVITPFKVEDRELTILVNRGWLPNKYKNAEERKKCQIQGTLEIVGVNRLNEIRPQFVHKNHAEKGIWHYRDLYEMAEFAETEPIYLDMISPDFGPGLPIPSQTRVNLRNEHLSYILTWYGIAAFTGYYWYRIFIKKRPIF